MKPHTTAQPTKPRADAAAPARLHGQSLLLQALQLVESVRQQQHDPSPDEYKTVIMGLGPLIMQSGLMQACAFLLAKDSHAHRAALRHLVGLLRNDPTTDNEAAQDWFQSQLLSCDRLRYRLWCRRALQASTALKRYTQALLKDHPGSDPRSRGTE